MRMKIGIAVVNTLSNQPELCLAVIPTYALEKNSSSGIVNRGPSLCRWIYTLTVCQDPAM